MMAFKNERITTAARPAPKLRISIPGMICPANKTPTPVMPHRIKNPFILTSYRPLTHCLKQSRLSDDLGGQIYLILIFLHLGKCYPSPDSDDENCGQGNDDKTTNQPHKYLSDPKCYSQVEYQYTIIQSNAQK